jgi:nucleoid DNA-binding protein
MTKRELVVKIAQETGLTQREVRDIVQRLLDLVIDSLVEGETVELRNFGIFAIRHRKARMGRNPNAPAQGVEIPAQRVVKFKPGKVMRERVMDAG